MRRGSLEWSLETVGKLIFYALVLIAIVWMTFRLVSIFTHGETDWRAKRNLQLLTERIEEVQAREKYLDIILAMPESYALLGFDDGTKPGDNITFDGGLIEDDLFVMRPDCGTACVCAFELDSGLSGTTSRLVTCEEIEEIDAVTGVWETIAWRQEDFGADYHPDVTVPILPGGRTMFAFGGNLGPTSVRVTILNRQLSFSSTPYAQP